MRPAGPLRAEVCDLINRLDPDGERLVVDLLTRSSSTDTVLITPDLVAQAVGSYAWLLERVGDDGMALTSSGYLPPAVVREAMTVLGDELWVGAANREHHTAPVLHLRESATRFGLLRKRKGHLLLTPTGRALRHDQQALFAHLAHCAPDTADGAAQDAGFLLLLAVTGGAPITFGSVDSLLVRGLTALGWARPDGPLRPYDGYRLAQSTMSLLQATGGLTRHSDQDRCTDVGRTFARAALRDPA